MDYRLFINENGYTYKAEFAKSPADMERLNPSFIQLEVLPDNGEAMSYYDWQEAIRLYSITHGVLA